MNGCCRKKPEEGLGSCATLRAAAGFASLKNQILGLEPERVKTLTAKLDSYVAERGQPVVRLQEILADRGLTVHAKEETLLRLALEDKELDKAIRDLRRGVVNILEEEHPDMKYALCAKNWGKYSKGWRKSRSSVRQSWRRR